jgi:hypothetical protein
MKKVDKGRHLVARGGGVGNENVAASVQQRFRSPELANYDVYDTRFQGPTVDGAASSEDGSSRSSTEAGGVCDPTRCATKDVFRLQRRGKSSKRGTWLNDCLRSDKRK